MGAEVDEARILEASPGVPVQAGYATLRNRGSGELGLTGADSAEFGRIEFHAMEQGAVGMRMRRVERPTVPSGGSLVFAPGGLHLMLFQPRRELLEGREVALTLHCGQDSLAVRFVVEAASP